MSKKYIIEIEEAPYMNVRTTSEKLYKAVGFNSLVFDKNGLDKLTPYSADEVYAKGHEHGYINGHEAAEKAGAAFYDDGYQRGLDDAWDAARKLVLAPDHGGYSLDKLDKCFETYHHDSHVCLEKTSAKEVVEAIREYEERKAQEDAEIKGGDEVCFTMLGQEIKGIAVGREMDDGWNVLDERGSLMRFGAERLNKTGRHVDLSEIFGGENA